MNESNDGHFHRGLFYGILIGLGVAWLFGTSEGKKLRNQIVNKSEELLNSASEKVEELDEDFSNPKD